MLIGFALLLSFFAALSIGPVRISLFEMSATDRVILFNLRLPRILSAFFVGGGLALAGAIFAALAVHTEAVAGIVGRADLMAAGCCFLAWALWRRSAPAAAAAFLAALLCKESALVFPLWLVIVEPPRRALAWLGAALAAYVALRAATFGLVVDDVFRSANNNLLLDEPPGVRALTALAMLARALRLILVPLDTAAKPTTVMARGRTRRARITSSTSAAAPTATSADRPRSGRITA